MKMSWKEAKQCKARCKRTGERCKGPAVKGYNVCRMHGANPRNRGGNPRIKELNEARKDEMAGNTFAVTYGVYCKKLLTEEEREIYSLVEKEFKAAYGLDDQMDAALLHELAFRLAKSYRAQAAGDMKGLGIHANKIATLGRQLDIRRDQRNKRPKDLPDSPQALFLKIINHFHEGKLQPGQVAQLPAGDQSQVIDVESEDIEAREPEPVEVDRSKKP